MSLKALLFGSIGVLAETSDIQRRAYNQAFADKGLAWQWDPGTYRYLLQFVGGQARMRLLSRATNAGLSDAFIAEIHAHKTQLASAMVKAEVTHARPGVPEVIAATKQAGLKLGIVTSTQHANIAAVADAAGLDLSVFDVVVSNADVAQSKPDPAPYLYALSALGVQSAYAAAIEDTASSTASAVRAGIRVVATPGAFAADQDFRQAQAVVTGLLAADGGLCAPLQAMFEA